MSDSPAIMDANPDGKIILVVDDEFDVLSAYTMLFEYRGYRVRTAGNGAEALALAARERPDIVVSDYMMPVMDGAQLCLQWRPGPASRARTKCCPTTPFSASRSASKCCLKKSPACSRAARRPDARPPNHANPGGT